MSNTIDVCQTGYDYEQFRMNELENENMKLREQLKEAKEALKSIQKDFERNGACEEDCVGYYTGPFPKATGHEVDGLKKALEQDEKL